MQLSVNLARGGRTARLVLVTAAAVAAGGLAGCGGGDETAQLIHATIKVQSITQQGQCEDVNIKVTPVQILPGAPKLANSTEMVTPGEAHQRCRQRLLHGLGGHPSDGPGQVEVHGQPAVRDRQLRA